MVILIIWVDSSVKVSVIFHLNQSRYDCIHENRNLHLHVRKYCSDDNTVVKFFGKRSTK